MVTYYDNSVTNENIVQYNLYLSSKHKYHVFNGGRQNDYYQ